MNFDLDNWFEILAKYQLTIKKYDDDWAVERFTKDCEWEPIILVDSPRGAFVVLMEMLSEFFDAPICEAAELALKESDF